MRPPVPLRSGMSRETRLLLVTIAVSVAVLLLLARFRFPDPPDVPAPAPPPVQAPLARLAAEATYEELAAIVRGLAARISAQLVVLRVGAPPTPELEAVDVSAAALPAPELPRAVTALRVSPETAVALLAQDEQIQGVAGNADAVPVTLASDLLRRLALVRIPRGQVADGLGDPVSVPATPGYLVAVEAGVAGPTTRPWLVGRLDFVSDPRWNETLWVVGGSVPVQAGSLIFSLDGRFLGMALAERNLVLIVPAPALVRAADALSRGGTPRLGNLGVQVQALTPGLAAVSGAAHGAVVTWVNPSGPAAGMLQIGDVIDAVDGEPTFSPTGLLLRIARRTPGTPAALRVLRAKEVLELEVTLGATRPAPRSTAPSDLGLVLRSVAGVGSEVVRVTPGSAAAHAGIRLGDVVLRVDATETPTPAQVARAFARASSGARLVLNVRRGTHHLLLVLDKP